MEIIRLLLPFLYFENVEPQFFNELQPLNKFNHTYRQGMHFLRSQRFHDHFYRVRKNVPSTMVAVVLGASDVMCILYIIIS